MTKIIKEALTKAIPRSQYIEHGFGFADFTLVKNKQPILYCIIVLHSDADIVLDYNKLSSWSSYNKLFGPIPLALVRSKKFNEVEAKRVSLSWDTEYAVTGELGNYKVIIPATGFVKL